MKNKCKGKGFQHKGRCYKYKAEIFYPNGKSKIHYSNKLRTTFK